MGQILQRLSAPSSKSRQPEVFTSSVKCKRPEKLEPVSHESNSPFRFLFIGETGAGKSSTISNLFDLMRPIPSDGSDFIQIWRQDSIEVIELRGLLETGSLEDDAPAIAAFLIFLKTYFAREVPTLIFVTARDSDNRFEGCSSNFSQVLQGVKLLLNEISDSKYSNVVLLLSSGRGADEVDFKITRYQAAFKEVIKMEQDVPCLAVSRESAVDDFRSILKDKALDFTPIKEFLSYLDNSYETKSSGFIHEEKTLKEFKTDEFRSIQRKILNCVISGVFSDVDFFPSDEDRSVETKTADSERQVLKFCTNYIIKDNFQGFEPVLEEANILMADGSLRVIHKCQVGDKVTSLSHKDGIITAIFKMAGSQTGVQVNTFKRYVPKQEDNVSKKFRDSWNKLVKQDSGENSETQFSPRLPSYILQQTLIKRKDNQQLSKHKHALYWTHDFSIDRFALVSLDQVTVTRDLDSVYFIQIDNGCGTFVADGIVRACTVMSTQL